MCSCGLPHSDICGSQLICSSPQLFAAYRVLHRLPVPRHPPCALIRLTNCFLTFTVLVAVLVRTRGLSHCHAVSPACPPVFPGCQLIRYLCDNASIDVSRRHPHLIAAVRPLLWDACVSYSSCASHSFELDTFCKIIVYAVFKVRIPQHPSLPAALSRTALHAAPNFSFYSGGHLLSRTVSSEVPSAVWVLTVVFGMGTGVSPIRIAARSLSH